MKGEKVRINETILFGKYRIISTLGAGNTSTVYLAEHIKLNVYRAIKCIPKGTALVTSFSLEAQLLKDLNHPGIPVIYDIEEDDGFYYMVEEFIQGESLDTFVSHQRVSHELLLKFGIQLCDILYYLHNYMPYPILYQDLKPEHIIVCGDDLKLIDFGIASFFTGSGENYQIYGTEEFAAPEALAGLPVSPQADIYSLGKLLEYLSHYSDESVSAHFCMALQKATAVSTADRYETILLFREDLEKELTAAYDPVSHLTRKIFVFGSKTGVGTTHISISLVSCLNQSGYPAVYMEHHASDSLHSMLRANSFIRETDGMLYHQFFRGIPDYGPGVVVPEPKGCITVYDCGVYDPSVFSLQPGEQSIFVLSGSLWDMEHVLFTANRFAQSDHVAFLCNYDNRSAAKRIAAKTGRKIYCFPFDRDPFSGTEEKRQLFFDILSFKRRKRPFYHFKKRLPFKK